MPIQTDIMKKYRLIFYLVFLTFHLALFLFTLQVDDKKENFEYLIKLQGSLHLFKYGAFFGLLLVGIDFFWTLLSTRAAETEKNKIQQEVNTLKAKLFDTTEAARKVPPAEESEKGEPS